MLEIRHSHEREPFLTLAILLSLVVHAMMVAACFLGLDVYRKVQLPVTYINVEIKSPDTSYVEPKREVTHPTAMQKSLKTDSAIAYAELTKPEEIKTVAMNAPRKALKKEIEIGTIPHPNNGGLERKIEASGENGSSREETGIIAVSHSVISVASGSNPLISEASRVNSIEPSYLALLRELIAGKKEYPVTARKGRLEGTVHISCVISRSGEIMGTRVSGSSGYSVLDNAALRAVRSVGRFPPIPLELKGESFSFVAPIKYSMADY